MRVLRQPCVTGASVFGGDGVTTQPDQHPRPKTLFKVLIAKYPQKHPHSNPHSCLSVRPCSLRDSNSSQSSDLQPSAYLSSNIEVIVINECHPKYGALGTIAGLPNTIDSTRIRVFIDDDV